MRIDRLFRTLVIDDEPLARRSIIRVLRLDREIEVAGECGDGRSAVRTIRELRPDIIFLDVQMPEMTGFEVLDSIAPPALPVTIFVTAHDQYAIRAFEVHALDYVLKPFRRERLLLAIDRAKGRLRADGGESAKILALLSELRVEREYLRRIAANDNGRIVFLDVESVDCIEAAGNYIRVHAGSHSLLIRQTLGDIERRLNPKEFLRIHRSTIVNVRHVKEIHPWFRGHHVVLLDTGRRVRLSRHQRAKLDAIVNGV